MSIKLEGNHCKKCNALISSSKRSGYCRICYLYYKNLHRRKKLKKEKKCMDCNEKVNPIVIFPDGLNGIKKVKYTLRCYHCREKRNKHDKSKKRKM